MASPLSNEVSNYLLQLRLPEMRIEEDRPWETATQKGYHIPGGIVGELMSLFALVLRCRFYLVAMERGQLTETSVRIRDEYPFFRFQCSPNYYPEIHSGDGAPSRHMDQVRIFLDDVRKLDSSLHFKFARACLYYHSALREIGRDEELAFVRLVSAIEVLSKDHPLPPEETATIEQGFDMALASDQWSAEQRKALEDCKRSCLYKTGKRFVEFLRYHSSGYGAATASPPAHLCIPESDIAEYAKRIYGARSLYLHEARPMYLSKRMPGWEQGWHVSLDQGMAVDRKRYRAEEKLPYLNWFEGLVRHCLVRYLAAHVRSAIK
ncbi:hypothetical protein HY634_02965 [Candidatus Uhrbacteria bacterium]|nr:hypothetical protein [Candidatus Uhrbacteria bacterium]